jgi:hypothetical protein
MAKLTPEEFADKQANRLKSAVEDIRRGVERIKDNPMQKAAKKKDKYLQSIQHAVTSGKWERSLNAVPLDDWKTALMNKGINRLPQGIDEAHAKMVEFAKKLNDFQDKLAQQVNAMPDNTPEDRINKMVAWVRGMSKFTK